MRAGNHLVFVWASNLTWFICAWSKLTCFQMVDETWLNLSVGMKLIGLLCGRSKLIFFRYKDWHWHGWLCGGGTYSLCLVSESNWTLFWCRGLEIDLILGWGSKNYLNSVMGSNLTCFLCAGLEFLRFSVEIGTDFFHVRGSKLTCFLRGAQNIMFLCGDRFTWFWCGWPKWTWFFRRTVNHLVLMWAPKFA